MFQDAEQQFIQDLALFFCVFLKEHGSLIEKQQLNDGLLKALHYLLLISEVDEVEIFKICLEYWNSLCSDLYRESPFSSSASPLFMSRYLWLRRVLLLELPITFMLISIQAEPHDPPAPPVLPAGLDQGALHHDLPND